MYNSSQLFIFSKQIDLRFKIKFIKYLIIKIVLDVINDNIIKIFIKCSIKTLI